MKDRIPTKPGRVLLTPEDGSSPFYATITRADEPTQEGDPLSKDTLLRDETAARYGFDETAVPDDVFFLLSKKEAIGNLVIEKIVSSMTWIAPKAVNQAFKVFGVGGGGGGNGEYGGGGGGGYVVIQDLTISEGTNVNIVCGAGGSAGTDGGITSFGDYFSANGGRGATGSDGADGGSGGGGASAPRGNGGNGGTYGGGGGAGYSKNGGNGGTYGGGGGTSEGTPGSGGTYGGAGGNGTYGENGKIAHFSLIDALLTFPNFTTTAKRGESLGSSYKSGGGGGGYGGNGGNGGNGTGDSRAGGGGGGGYGGNGGSSNYGYGSGGGGGYGGNGGNGGTYGGGGGGGLLCDGADANQRVGGGGGGIVSAGGSNGGDGGCYIVYYKEETA